MRLLLSVLICWRGYSCCGVAVCGGVDVVAAAVVAAVVVGGVVGDIVGCGDGSVDSGGVVLLSLLMLSMFMLLMLLCC